MKERNILLAMGWYYPAIHQGVARFARDHHWHLTADFDDPVPKHWHGNGVLTLLSARENLWRELKHFKVPIVDFAESRPEISLPRVTMDNAAIAQLAADYFLQHGFRNFAYVQRYDLGVSRRRRDFFVERVASKNLACTVLAWPKERKTQADSRENRHVWLKKRLLALPKPLAVFARDAEAVEVIEACLSAGIQVPEQIAVLGVDNTEIICDFLRVPLSSIDNRLEQIGYEGARLLQRLMDGAKPPKTPIYIAPAGVVERLSTDCLAVEHPKVRMTLRYIQDHYQQSIEMRDLMTLTSMSRSGLEKAFREHFVRPPMEQVRHVRLELAKRLLASTKDKIIEIAQKTGFETSHKFCRNFRQAYRMSPGAYRSQRVDSQHPYQASSHSKGLSHKRKSGS